MPPQNVDLTGKHSQAEGNDFDRVRRPCTFARFASDIETPLMNAVPFDIELFESKCNCSLSCHCHGIFKRF